MNRNDMETHAKKAGGSQGYSEYAHGMLDRIPEHECMDTPEEAREYAAMDHAEVNLAFVEALEKHGCVRGELLDLGTGPGHIPLILAERHERLSVTGIDLSKEMLKIARLKVAQAGYSRRIRLLEADAKKTAFGQNTFDVVFSNTILHHVSDPVAFLSEARRVLRPKGALLIRDLMRPETQEDLERIVTTYAGDASDRQRELFRESLYAAYTVDEVREFCNQAGLEDVTIEVTSDRHLTVWLEPR